MPAARSAIGPKRSSRMPAAAFLSQASACLMRLQVPRPARPRPARRPASWRLRGHGPPGVLLLLRARARAASRRRRTASRSGPLADSTCVGELPRGRRCFARAPRRPSASTSSLRSSPTSAARCSASPFRTREVLPALARRFGTLVGRVRLARGLAQARSSRVCCLRAQARSSAPSRPQTGQSPSPCASWKARAQLEQLRRVARARGGGASSPRRPRARPRASRRRPRPRARGSGGSQARDAAAARRRRAGPLPAARAGEPARPRPGPTPCLEIAAATRRARSSSTPRSRSSSRPRASAASFSAFSRERRACWSAACASTSSSRPRIADSAS